MAYLSGWNQNNRIHIKIDHTKIDSTLTNFPIRLHLGQVVGISQADLRKIFTELGSNSKKIAITTDDGTTQCYAEIEQWDNANQVAELWINVPSISSTADTVLYLYYDSTHADNSSYVGDTGETPAQSVWDSNFKVVYHMSQDPSGTAPQIKDSTVNVINGTSNGAMTSGDLINAKIGKGLDFDGIDDYIDLANSSTIGTGIAATFSILLYMRSFPTVTDRILSKWQSSNLSYELEIGPTGTVSIAYSTTGSNVIGGASIGTISLNTWTRVTFTNNGANSYGFLNIVKGVAGSGGNFYIGTSNIQIAGSSLETNRDFDGIIDDIQISNIVRSDAWIKAAYYSNFDLLLLFLPSPPTNLTLSCGI